MSSKEPKVAQSEENILYYGDNLDILRRHIKDESVDLVYLDPPFKSNQDYNVLFAEKNGSQAAAQIKAFEDTWRWDQQAAKSFHEIVEGGGKVSQVMQAFRTFIGESDMLAYLSMMAPRLVELRRVLKESGSIYLHCDPTASHYLKLLMDAVFSPQNFSNEIIWKRTLPHGNVRQMFGRSHDIILFYSKSTDSVWNRQYDAHREEYLDQFYRHSDPGTGRIYRLVSCINPNPNRPNLTYEWNGVKRVWKWTKERMQKAHDNGLLVYSKTGIPSYKNYLDEMKGTPMQDIWTDIPPLMGSSQERLGYPTQKPEALLERIVLASSDEGHIVLDPFCGCGTAIAVAQRTKRKWIGIDITHLAITLIKHRLYDTFQRRADFKVIGEPEALPDAETLAKEDPYQFQWWALGLVGARPVEQKKGADKGVDGRLYFHDDPITGKTKQIIFSVKAGHVTAPHIRDLRGVVERERAEIGVLISLEGATKPMRTEAASGGFYNSPWGKKYPRIQILTVRELLEGKQVDYPPPQQVNVTFKKAPKADDPDSKEIREQIPLMKK